MHNLDAMTMERRIEQLARYITDDRKIAQYLTESYGFNVTVGNVAAARKRLAAHKRPRDYKPIYENDNTLARKAAEKGSAALADKLAAYRIGRA